MFRHRSHTTKTSTLRHTTPTRTTRQPQTIRRPTRLWLVPIAMWLCILAASSPAHAQGNFVTFRSQAVFRTVAGLATWIENDNWNCAAAAYHAAWGRDCTVAERSSGLFGANRSATGLVTAYLPPQWSENGCAKAGSQASCIRLDDLNPIRGQAQAWSKSIHFGADQHASIARSWVRLNGRQKAYRDGIGARLAPTSDNSSPSLSASMGSWPDGTVLAIVTIDTLEVATRPGAFEPSYLEAALRIDGLEVWSTTLSLEEDGTPMLTGDITGGEITTSYEAGTDQWLVSMYGYEVEIPIDFVEEGEEVEFDADFEFRARAADEDSGGEPPVVQEVPLQAVVADQANGEPQLLGQFVHIQEPLLLFNDGTAFAPWLDTDATNGFDGIGLFDPRLDMLPGQFNPGDIVDVAGFVNHVNGRTVLMSPEIFVIDSQPLPPPMPLTIDEALTNAEQLEGMLITLQDVELADIQMWPPELTNGLVPIQDPTGMMELQIPGENWIQPPPPIYGPFQVTGILFQDDNGDPYWDGYQLRVTGPGAFVPNPTSDVDDAAPMSLNAHQLFVSPNPVRASSQLHYQLPASGPVTVTLHDIVGRRVATLQNGTVEAGAHTLEWNRTGDDGHRLSSGVYFGRVTTQQGTKVAKVVLVD